VCACTGTSFSASLIIGKLILLFLGRILDLYQENLIVLGGESTQILMEARK
jgi:hypothetical protein